MRCSHDCMAVGAIKFHLSNPSLKEVENFADCCWFPRLHMTFIRGTAQHILCCLPSYADSNDVVHFLPSTTLPLPSPVYPQHLPTFTPTTL